MISIRNILGLIALLLIAGCGTATDSASPVTGISATSSSTVLVVKPSEVFQGYELSGEVLDRVDDVRDEISALVNRYEEKGITAGELNDAANEIISSHAEDPFLRVAIPQVVSLPALHAFLESENTENLDSYIAHHTQMLVDNDSPHADEISQALAMLDGYWDAEKIHTVAKKAIENAEYYLGKNNAHAASKAAENHGSTDVPVENLQESSARIHAEMGSGVQRLERLLEK